jgi:hypothetical protein
MFGEYSKPVKQSKWNNQWVRVAAFCLMLAAAGIDYLVSWPGAETKQRAAEKIMESIRLPENAIAGQYSSGHKTHSGYVSRTFITAESSVLVCEFFSSQFQADYLKPIRDDCPCASQDAERYMGGTEKRALIEFSKPGYDYMLIYKGHPRRGITRYDVVLEWR